MKAIMKKLLWMLLSTPLLVQAQSDVPPQTDGVGAAPCSQYVTTYDALHATRQREREVSSETFVLFGKYGDFRGMYVGYMKAFMDANNGSQPFQDDASAMRAMYDMCKAYPTSPYLQVVDSLARAALENKVPSKKKR